MHKLLPSPAELTLLLQGLHSDDQRRRQELTNDEKVVKKGSFRNKIQLMDLFGFADQAK